MPCGRFESRLASQTLAECALESLQIARAFASKWSVGCPESTASGAFDFEGSAEGHALPQGVVLADFHMFSG